MRPVICFFVWLVASCSPRIRQEQMRMAPSQLLRQSSDVFRAESGPAIQSVKGVFLQARSLNVRYADGHSEIVPRSEVWGFSDRKGKIYRLYKRSQYEVVNIDDVVTYEQEVARNYPINGQTTTSYDTEKFYSKTLDSRIFSSRRKAVEDVGTL